VPASHNAAGMKPRAYILASTRRLAGFGFPFASLECESHPARRRDHHASRSRSAGLSTERTA
jgi:hypothetical protein